MNCTCDAKRDPRPRPTARHGGAAGRLLDSPALASEAFELGMSSQEQEPEAEMGPAGQSLAALVRWLAAEHQRRGGHPELRRLLEQKQRLLSYLSRVQAPAR